MLTTKAKPLARERDEGLASKVRGALAGVKNVQEKRMSGSMAFVVNGKFCIGARESRIICRVDPALRDELIARRGCRPMTMNGREYRGYVSIESSALLAEKDLRFWVGLALDYNAGLKESGKRR